MNYPVKFTKAQKEALYFEMEGGLDDDRQGRERDPSFKKVMKRYRDEIWDVITADPEYQRRKAEERRKREEGWEE